MVPDKVKEDTPTAQYAPYEATLHQPNGKADDQTWLIEKVSPAGARVNWEDIPLWSGIGSVVLIVAVIFFDHPSVTKYALLFLSQICYLLSIVMRS